MTTDLVFVPLRNDADLAGFRAAARSLIAQQVPPERAHFTTEQSLFGGDALADAPPLGLPKAVASLIPDVVCHRDPERYALLYQLVWRVLHGERALLEVGSDPLVHRLHLMRKEIAREIHKMHAFVRFRQVDTPEGEHYVAWFEPEHFILGVVGPFFRDRFGSLVWSILTPLGSIHWNRSELVYGPPAMRADAPDADAFESGWRTYYESVFNPARLNETAMRAEMPKRYWKNLPEAQSIPVLMKTAGSRVQDMVAQTPTQSTKRQPDAALARMHERSRPNSLEALNLAIAGYVPPQAFAPKPVLGEGPAGASIMFIGEQPGDQEEAEGRPFVGPAGQLLEEALRIVGIDRREAYLTNAVKHFKFEQRGKRRIHVTPSASEVKHYRWWLMDEIELVSPQIIVALGATAALSLTGQQVSIMRARGPAAFGGKAGYITTHPSYLLRLPDASARSAAYDRFLDDLRQAKALVEV